MYAYWLLPLMAWMICFKLDKGTNIRFAERGGGGDDEVQAPAKVDPYEEASRNTSARLAFDRPIAMNEPAIQSEVIPQLTNLYSGVREQSMPGGAGLMQSLLGQVGTQLTSPTGLTPEQQASQDALRQLAQQRLVESMRTQANLGGGLFGGRSQASEARSVGELQNLFVNEDIDRQIQQQQQAQNMALSILGAYLGQSIPTLNYSSAVVDPNQQYAGAVSQNNLYADLQAQQQAQRQANQSALYSSLFQGLGTAAGGFLGGPGGAMIGSNLGKKAGSWTSGNGTAIA